MNRRTERTVGRSSTQRAISYLEGSLAYALHRAQLSTMESIRTAFSDHAITAFDFLVLVAIAENPDIKQGDLAARLEVAKPRIVPILHKLERRGLANRRLMAGDGRVRRLELTKVGRHLVRILRKRAEELQRGMMQELDPSEAGAILPILRKLAASEQLIKRSTERL